MPIQIEDIFRGLATGLYFKQVGSQFKTLWQFDDLSEAEATAEEYRAFNASADVQLGHGQQIEWLGRKWDVILAYRRQALAQVSIYTRQDNQIMTATTDWLTSLFGKPNKSVSAFVWVGRDGTITLTRANTFLQVDAGQFTLFQRLIAKIRGLF